MSTLGCFISKGVKKDSLTVSQSSVPLHARFSPSPERLSPSWESPEPEKVQNLFNQLAERYDFFNRSASLGLDQLWRRRLIEELLSCEVEGKTILDLGTGTGDLLLLLLSQGKGRLQNSKMIGVDFSQGMLKNAGERFQLHEKRNLVSFLLAEAEQIPLEQNSVDMVMSAFTLRNMKKKMPEIFKELQRVLKTGGQVFFLEMYPPEQFLLQFLHRIYLHIFLPIFSQIAFGEALPASYLRETILHFWKPEEFSNLLERMGFTDVRYISIHGGIAGLHYATKRSVLY